MLSKSVSSVQICMIHLVYVPRIGSGGPAATALQVDAERNNEKERAVRREKVVVIIEESTYKKMKIYGIEHWWL